MITRVIIEELKCSLCQFTTRELVVWKGHVLMNPYRGGDSGELSRAVVAMLDEELGKREKMRKEYGVIDE